MGTSTSSFGVGRRESHDSTDFYARFAPPEISADDVIGAPGELDVIHVGDARDMSAVPDASVALVVTSPPYFAGKQYETALGEGHVPADYIAYLTMLRDVLAESVRTLEPGGRIAVNVANLGRRPYRNLAADVTTILQDDLRLLLRGEVVWQKQRGASGSCAWGSYQSPANPVLRDTSERVIIASKGRFDRVGQPAGPATIPGDEFMEATLDIWEIQAESATRVGHPAPFPVALVERCLHLLTYQGDVVLDPFMGSGTTAVAAVNTGRRYIGYDTDEGYVRQARDRIASLPATPLPDRRTLKEHARVLLDAAGYTGVSETAKVSPGVTVSFSAVGPNGARRLFELGGVHTPARPGLSRVEAIWRTIAKASIARQLDPATDVVVLTSGHVRGGPLAVAAGDGGPIRAIVDVTAPDAVDVLRARPHTADVVTTDAAPPRGQERPGDRRALQSVSVQFFANGVVYASFIPELPAIRERVGISIGALGLVLTLASISGLIGSLLTGRVIARLGTRRVVIIGTIMSIGSLPIVGFATAPAMLVVGLVGLLFFDVFIDVAMNVQGSVLSARRHTPVMNRLHGLWSLGGVTGGVITVLVNRADVSVQVHLAVVTVALLGVSLFVVPGLLKVDEPHEPDPVLPVGEGLHGTEVMATEEVATAIRRRRFGPAAVVLAIGGATAMVLEVGNGDWAAFRLSVDFDSSAGVASAAFLLMTIGMTIGRLGGDWVQVRTGSMRLRRLGLTVAGVGSVLATLVPIEAVSLVGFLIAGLGTSVLFPQLYDQAARLPGPPGSGFAAMLIGQRSTGIVAPLVIGTLANTDLFSVGGAMAVLVVPAAIVGLAITYVTINPRTPS